MTRPDPSIFDRPNGTHADGRALNGALHAQHEVHCPAHEDFLNGLSHRLTDAAAELRRHGWTLRGGLWRCQPCSERIS